MKAKISSFWILHIHIALALAAVLSVANSATAAELRPKTIAAFDHYVVLSEAKIDASLNDRQTFLWVDRLPPEQRAAILAHLRGGRRCD